jgi:hypothetical protein
MGCLHVYAMTLNQILTLIVAGAMPVTIFVMAWMVQGANRRSDAIAVSMLRIEVKIDATGSKVDNLSGQLKEHLREHNR